MVLTEERRSQIKQGLKNQRRRNIKRGISILSGFLIIIYAIYAYFFIIFFPVQVKGYVYGSHFENFGKQNNVLHVSYKYFHKDKTYYSSEKFIITNDIKQGDSIYVTVSKYRPEKHKVIRPFFNDILNVKYIDK